MLKQLYRYRKIASVKSIFSWMLIFWLFLSTLLAGNSTGFAASQIQEPENNTQDLANQLLREMSPEERVGQLFITTFNGNDLGEDSPIYSLITKYHIGGVVLKVSNDNFVSLDANQPMSFDEVLAQNRTIQQVNWRASSKEQPNSTENSQEQPPFIPLWIGFAQNAERYPNNQTIPGMTRLPNPMAIGATWNTKLSEQVGTVLGREMSSLGFNLLIGPSLDVLEARLIETTGTQGTRSFGGDPYWVSEMGKAYIRGVHTGSNQRVAVIAKHFPGHGSSDRLPEEEVSTIRKSLEELKSFDLAPFFAVTGNATSLAETTDGLLTSHIRYQGLQGSIRATTRPVSFDPQALSLLTSLPPLDSWRQNGGLMISDDLGSPAVRRFYELTSQTFDARRVALNAFLSGNDLLYIGDFTGFAGTDPLLAAIRTLEFFSQKYREDAAFAQRVDESVLRILSRKFHLYGNFSLVNIIPTNNKSGEENPSTIIFEVARQAATLISPSAEDLEENIPDPPNQNDRLVFISDTRTSKSCSQCDPISIIKPTNFQDSVIRLYGPAAGGQINASHLSSYTLQDLDVMLNQDPDATTLQRDIQRTNWIIFAMLDPQTGQPSYQTLAQFLSERPDLFQQKKLIVFTFSEPSYLDATNISKLTAFYSLYSPLPPFIDIAAYLLFKELRPTGAPPISIPGIGYDLNEALFPNPDLQIRLELDVTTAETTTPQASPYPTLAPEFRIGDTVPLRTGVILDHNGNPVPDGTQVVFILSFGTETTSLRQTEYTHGGVARTVLTINNTGAAEIHAESENAISNTIKYDIPAPVANGMTTPLPEQPTQTPEPTPTLEPTPEISPTPLPEVKDERPGFADWLIALLISMSVAWSAYKLSAFAGQMRWGIRYAFLSFIGGLLAYTYITLDLPGSDLLLQRSTSLAVTLSTFGGSLLGLWLVVVWKKIDENITTERQNEIAKP